jgi:hypothetical protein
MSTEIVLDMESVVSAAAATLVQEAGLHLHASAAKQQPHTAVVRHTGRPPQNAATVAHQPSEKTPCVPHHTQKNAQLLLCTPDQLAQLNEHQTTNTQPHTQTLPISNFEP